MHLWRPFKAPLYCRATPAVQQCEVRVAFPCHIQNLLEIFDVIPAAAVIDVKRLKRWRRRSRGTGQASQHARRRRQASYHDRLVVHPPAWCVLLQREDGLRKRRTQSATRPNSPPRPSLLSRPAPKLQSSPRRTNIGMGLTSCACHNCRRKGPDAGGQDARGQPPLPSAVSGPSFSTCIASPPAPSTPTTLSWARAAPAPPAGPPPPSGPPPARPCRAG